MRYGIYRCSIEVEDHKLMRQNKCNYYTHIDITRARELQYNIILIEDDEPNVLYYSREKQSTRVKLLDHLLIICIS